jgi:hypothetical protein
MAACSAYYGITVTLSDTNAHKLLDLLQAIDATVPATCSGLMIQADDSNGPNYVYIGDSAVASTRMAYSLLFHEGNPYQKTLSNGFPLYCLYVRASAATCKLNVEIVVM